MISKILWSFTLTLLLEGCLSHDRGTLYSKEFPDKIIIDGDLSDWPDDLEEIIIEDREISQGDHTRILSDNRVNCTSIWNSEHLFLAFKVEDTRLNAYQTERDHLELYLDDMVEFLFDPHLHRTDKWLPDNLIYHINILNRVKDDRGTESGDNDVSWDGKARHSVKINGTINDDSDIDKGYILEVAIPWSELGVEPESGTQMGFNFANGDNDGKGRQLFDWMSSWPMRNPSQYGTVKLMSE